MVPGPIAIARRELTPLLRSVVKVLCVSDAPDFDQPWQTHGPSSGFGSGCIIATASGPRVLTNAHCVANHVFVELRRYGNAQKYVAEIEAIGHACDLALLNVEDASFFQGTTPIELGELPRLSERVSVCGYPIGGDRISITEGIVSRIELVNFAQSSRSLLAVQIDAAVNAGNSGGPVIQDGRLVGVAFQALDEAEQIGYMIAMPVVEHFLRDVERGEHEGFPDLGVTTQPLESRAHRMALGLPASRPGGIVVTRVVQGGSADGVLLPDDVLLEVDGVEIARDGTAPLREGEMIDFSHVVSMRHVGEQMPFTVWRDGRERSCTVGLLPPRPLVADQGVGTRPRYFVVGGLVFVPLTRHYLETWGEAWSTEAPRELVQLSEHGVRAHDRDEPVLLQKVLADRVNQGYHDLGNVLIVEAEGVPVRSLPHLVELVEAARGEFLSLRAADGRIIVIDRRQARDRHEAILKKFGVPFDRSDELRMAELRNAELRNAELRTDELRMAELRNAELRMAELRNADLRRLARIAPPAEIVPIAEISLPALLRPATATG
ncbi:MAG: trypsin-like serine protease [Myxococcales bacterium]|nr:trypsin-like serine protease [Myxococcales bacterium]